MYRFDTCTAAVLTHLSANGRPACCARLIASEMPLLTDMHWEKQILISFQIKCHKIVMNFFLYGTKQNFVWFLTDRKLSVQSYFFQINLRTFTAKLYRNKYSTHRYLLPWCSRGFMRTPDLVPMMPRDASLPVVSCCFANIIDYRISFYLFRLRTPVFFFYIHDIVYLFF